MATEFKLERKSNIRKVPYGISLSKTDVLKHYFSLTPDE
jgi:hypothetical protein